MIVYYLSTLIGTIMMYTIQRRTKRKSYVKDVLKEKDSKIAVYFIPFIPLYLVSALRYGIGTDYFYTYLPTYNRIKVGIDTGYKFEYGFLLINKFAAKYLHDFTWVMAICAFLFFIFVGLAIIEQSEDRVFSLVLFFGTGLFQFSLNGVRQAIVIAIWLYSLKYVKQKKYIYIGILCGVSFLFHASAIIIIPLTMLYQLKIKPRTSIMLIFLTLVFSMKFKSLILYLAGFTRYLSKHEGSILMEGNFAISEFVIAMVILIYLLFIYKKMKDNWEYNYLLMSTTLSAICCILTKDIYLIARINVFFRYATVIYLPATLVAFKKGDNRRIVKYSFIAFYLLVIWYLVGYLGQGESAHYASILSRPR